MHNRSGVAVKSPPSSRTTNSSSSASLTTTCSSSGSGSGSSKSLGRKALQQQQQQRIGKYSGTLMMVVIVIQFIWILVLQYSVTCPTSEKQSVSPWRSKRESAVAAAAAATEKGSKPKLTGGGGGGGNRRPPPPPPPPPHTVATKSNLPYTWTPSMASPKGAKHAYAFLMAGCDPPNNGYRGYLYNILVAAYILQHYDSHSDVVAMVRMSSAVDDVALSAEEERWLHEAGVLVRYLPKHLSDSFYSAQIEKFRILEMTQYESVLYMDADIIPLCNLDYIFHFPEPTNVVLTWKQEPAVGGFFLLRPGPGEFDELQAVVKRREERDGAEFDPEWGWGHVLTEADPWIDLRERSNNKWNFHAAYADQGLLYYWTKYHKANVSIIRGGGVTVWKDHEMIRRYTDGEDAFKEEAPLNPLLSLSCSSKDVFARGWNFRSPPYRDMHHFSSGRWKPWALREVPEVPADVATMQDATTVFELWFHVLRRCVQRYKMDLQVEQIQVSFPSLGNAPDKKQLWAKVNNQPNDEFRRRQVKKAREEYERRQRALEQQKDEETATNDGGEEEEEE